MGTDGTKIFPKVSPLFPQDIPTIFQDFPRPLTVSFQLRASGKETDMATPLGLEKYGRIDFSLGRWTTMGQNAPKLMLKHAKEQVELVRICLRSLLRPQESLFWRSSFICCKKYQSLKGKFIELGQKIQQLWPNFGQNHVYLAPISSMQWQTMQQW